MIRVPFPTMIVDLKNEQFVENWSKSTRYKVNRAEKENFIILRDNALLKDILDLFTKTARAKGLRGHTISDFDSRDWIICSAVFFEDKMLAGHVWIIDTQ
jgi:hypothetical protein